MGKNVVHIIDGLGIGGAERLLFDTVTRLDKAKFNVSVISLYNGSEEQPVQQQLEEAGMPVVVIPKKTKLGLLLSARIGEELRKRKADIVHTHLFAADVWGTLAADQERIQTIISTEHNINRSEGWIKHRLKTYTRKYAHTVIAISKAVENYIKEQYPYPVPIVEIPNGVDLKQFQNQNAQKRELSTVRMAVVGRLVKQKGHAELFETLKLVEQDYTLDIIGDGPLRQRLQTKVQKIGLADRVNFRGVVEKDIYEGIDIVIIPSRWEGFGLVAVEAMAAGCAVIASHVDGLAEIVEQEQSGLLVDVTDPVMTANTIEKVIEDSVLRGRLIEGGKERAQDYSIDSMVLKLEELYNTLT